MSDLHRSNADYVVVEDLSREDVAADVAAFLEGAEHVHGMILSTAVAAGVEVIIVLEDAYDGARTFRLRVVES